MITVVDLGVSNLRSIISALDFLGAESCVSDKPSDVERADRLILPGVGSFDEAVRRIDALKLRQPMRTLCDAGVPILGVCLGMQLLFERSEEGRCRGLGLMEGEAIRLGANPRTKVPHVGFDVVKYPLGSWLESAVGPSEHYYFTHSFAVRSVPQGVSTGTCAYDGGFVAAVERWPIVGAQFHPEKSQASGLKFLLAFLQRPAEAK